MDALSHGRTYHIPVGAIITFWELIIDFKRAVDHFKLDKVSILVHSLGGSTAMSRPSTLN